MNADLIATSVNIRLKAIEEEINNIKNLVNQTSGNSSSKKIVSLRGMLQDLSVTDKDIASARRSLFKHIEV